MAQTIKGIKIEIDGSTTGLMKSLEDVNKKTGTLQSELKQVERALKFNPGNTELVAQKQKLLADQVQATSEKLKRLKAAQADVDKQFAEGKISEKAYREFQREIVETESRLKHFEGQLASSQSKLKAFGDAAVETGEKMKNAGGKMKNVGKDLSLKVTAPLVAIAGAATKLGMDFEAQMSRVGAISGATAEEFDQLTESALKLGADTSKSANEVAIAMEDMAAMGFTATEILGAMPGVISASEASGESLALSAQTVAAALNIWGLEASEASRVADVLASAANNSAAGIDDMQLAFKYAGAPAAALGIGMEDVAAAIGIMTDAGLDGSNAGTSLRASLLALNNPATAQRKMMEKLGISMRDSEDNALSLSGMIEELKEATDGMTEADKVATLAKLVGTEAVSGFLSLMDAGPQQIDTLADSLRNSAGASEETAAVMKDNLKGALEELGGTFETAAITIYNNLKPALEEIVKAVQKVADWFNDLSPSSQNAILAFAGIAAAIGPILVVVGTLVAALGAIFTAIGTFSGAMAVVSTGAAAATPAVGTLAAVITALTGPIAIAVAAIIAIGAAFVLAYKKIDWFREGVDSVFASIKDVISNVLNAVVGFISSKLAEIQAFWDENGNLIKEATQNVWNAISAVIKAVMPVIEGIIKVVWFAIQVIVKSVWDNIKGVIDGALKIIMGLVKAFSGLLTGNWQAMWDGIKQLFSGAIELIWNAMQLMLWGRLLKGIAVFAGSFKGAVTSFWGAIQGVFTTVITAIRNFFTGGFNAMMKVANTSMSSIRTVITTVWNGIKTVFTTVVNTIRNTVTTGFSNVVNAIRNKLTEAVTAVRTKMSEMLGKVTEKATDFLNAGKDLIRGLIDGIKGMAKEAIGAITGVVDSVVNKAKDLLGIKSPSRVMMEIGDHVGKGLAIGVDSTRAANEKAVQGVAKVLTDVARKNAQEVSKIADEAEKKRTEIQREYAKKRADLNLKSSQSSQAALKTHKNKKGEIVKTGEQKAFKIRQDASAKLVKLNEEEQKKLKSINEKAWSDMVKKENEVAKERLEAAKNYVSDKKSMGELSLVAEAEVWRKSLALFREGTKERIEVQKSYQAALKAVNAEIESINKEHADKVQSIIENTNKAIQEQNDIYSNAFSRRVGELTNFAGMFDEFVVNMDKSGQDLINNLVSQVAGLAEWRAHMDSLWERTGDQAFMEELEAMGPKALGEIRALTSMSDTELESFVNLYNAKFNLARERATQELAGLKADTEDRIRELKDAANTELDIVRKEWVKKIASITKATDDELKSLKQIGVNAGQGLLNGLASMEGALVAKARSIANAVSAAMASALQVKSPSRVTMAIGEHVGEGLMVGMESMLNDIKRVATRMGDFAVPRMPNMAMGSVTGGGRTASGSTTNNVTHDYRGFMEGANFIVREEADIRKIARELHVLQKQAARGEF